MPDSSDIAWFKQQFQARIQPLLAGSPLSVDMIAAIACQETGEVWPRLRRKNMDVARILALCVGDTLDADKGRGAFPKTKADLLARPGGDRMFTIAHQALVDMAAEIPGYSAVAARPDKFCHAFGMFQYDLQFFLADPDYFLQKKYEQFEETLGKCLGELGNAVRKLGFQNRDSLSDMELAAVGIAYNTGGYKPQKGLKQGYFNGTSYYGELIFDFIRLAHTVAGPGASPAIPTPQPGEAIVPPPTPVSATGPDFEVRVSDSMLRLRSEPRISSPPQANVIANMPDGQPVRAVTGTEVKGFMEVQTTLSGALLQGFASTKFLVPGAPSPALAPERAPEKLAQALAPPGARAFEPRPMAPSLAQLPAAEVPIPGGRGAKRSAPAGALSLNEPRQPARSGASAEALRASLNAIVDWLAVDKPANRRYQPHEGKTFGNVYAHDYCRLAGVYLPRVWWTSTAIVSLAAGIPVVPRLGDTVVELRANDLFRWLREFGPLFGWRQTGTVSKLQQAANQGAVALIAARRREDGRSGHIVAVLPETGEDRARRDAKGEVLAPLQSEAGARNMRRGRGRAGWWAGEAFADSAFWIHA